MSTSVTFNGSSYTIPSTGEEDWGGSSKVDGFLVAAADNALAKSGGTFTLTADVDFGANFGLKSAYFTSRNSNAATSGSVRLCNAESIGWRNAGNSANITLTVNSSNIFVFNSPSAGPDGTPTAPTWGFFNDDNTGIYRVASDSLGVTVGGAISAKFTGGDLYASMDAAGTGAIRHYGNRILLNNSGTAPTTANTIICGSNSDTLHLTASSTVDTGRNILMYADNVGGGNNSRISLRRDTTIDFDISAAGLVTIGEASGTQIHRFNTSATASGAATATLTNAPAGAAGNPDLWMNINVNGTAYVLPLWTP